MGKLLLSILTLAQCTLWTASTGSPSFYSGTRSRVGDHASMRKNHQKMRDYWQGHSVWPFTAKLFWGVNFISSFKPISASNKIPSLSTCCHLHLSSMNCGGGTNQTKHDSNLEMLKKAVGRPQKKVQRQRYFLNQQLTYSILLKFWNPAKYKKKIILKNRNCLSLALKEVRMWSDCLPGVDQIFL